VPGFLRLKAAAVLRAARPPGSVCGVAVPELPEVETTCRGLAPHLLGRTVTAVTVRNPRLRWPIPADLPQQLQGHRLQTLERRGKYLLFGFAHGCLIGHLGMSGSMRILQEPRAVAKHDHVDIQFGPQVLLRYTDPRRFGALLWTAGAPAEHDLLASLGPEPLTDTFDAAYLFARSRQRTQAIKTFIMDSHVVVGVGNIYANEALFRAGIRPTKAAGQVSLRAYEQLVADIKTVLAQAIAQGGTTLRDFTGGDGKPGYFRQTLAVYGRGGQPCISCGKVLKEIKLGQRATVYCTRCQS
jgi:formamidopyrimidine-DNA glycosylase